MKKPSVKAKSTRRGRPLGSKNKPKGLEKQTAHWEAEPRQPSVDYKDLCQKLQNALAKSYADYQDLEKDLAYFTKKVDVLNAQLEIKQRYVEFLEVDVAHRKANAEDIFKEDNEDFAV